jgi:hypothetical protein
VGQKHVERSRRNEALGSYQVWLAAGLVVDARQVEDGSTERKRLSLAAQKAKSQARAVLFDLVLGIRIDFVIAQTPEDASFGAQPR